MSTRHRARTARVATLRTDSPKDEKKALENTRWALLKSPWNQNDSGVQTPEELEECNKPIFAALILKNSFAAILDRRQINEARDRLCQWISDARRSGLPHCDRVATTSAVAPRPASLGGSGCVRFRVPGGSGQVCRLHGRPGRGDDGRPEPRALALIGAGLPGKSSRRRSSAEEAPVDPVAPCVIQAALPAGSRSW